RNAICGLVMRGEVFFDESSDEVFENYVTVQFDNHRPFGNAESCTASKARAWTVGGTSIGSAIGPRAQILATGTCKGAAAPNGTHGEKDRAAGSDHCRSGPQALAGILQFFRQRLRFERSGLQIDSAVVGIAVCVQFEQIESMDEARISRRFG